MNQDQDPIPRNSADFQKTHWSLVMRAAKSSVTGSAEALEVLCAAYWYPLYVYVRRRGYNPTDAEDSTQAFFAKLLEKKSLASAHPSRGRFRSFLISSLNNFLADEYDKSRAQKRGGGRKPISLDAQAAEERYSREPMDSLTPEMIFERRWALELLERAQVRLREKYIKDGKEELYEILKQLHTDDRKELSYAEAAQKLGMPEGTLRSQVHRLKREKREFIRDEISRTVASPEDIDEEIRYLLNAISR